MNDPANLSVALSLTVPASSVDVVEELRRPLGVTRARMARIAFEVGLKAIQADPQLAAEVLPAIRDGRLHRR